jgi:hypothetical protein
MLTPQDLLMQFLQEFRKSWSMLAVDVQQLVSLIWLRYRCVRKPWRLGKPRNCIELYANTSFHLH